jgi:hypothetical protein
MVSDIFCALLFSYYLMKNKLKISFLYLRQLLFLSCLWLLSSVISDYLAETDLVKVLKNLSNIILFLFYIILYFNLANGDLKKLRVAIVGYSLANIFLNLLGLNMALSPGFFGESWKFGTGIGVTFISIFILDYFLKQRFIKGLFITLLMGVHFLENARSLGLKIFLAFLSSIVSKFNFNKFNSKILGLVSLVLLILLVPLGEATYGKFASGGYFGEDAKLKYEMQTAGGVGILLGGRSEVLISTEAILAKPFFGFGSYAENRELRLEYVALKAKINGEIPDWDKNFVTRSDLIPSHSFLFGTWVNHGVFSALFWIFCLYIFYKALTESIFGQQSFSIAEFLVFYTSIWHILFSPFGLSQRVEMSIFLVTACVVIGRSRIAEKS